MIFARPLPKILTASLALFFITFLLTHASSAQPQASAVTPPKADARVGALLDQLGRTQSPLDVAISPDSRLLAWSGRSKELVQLHLLEILPDGDGKASLISTGSAPEHCGTVAPAWSPDGESLAFLSSCNARQNESGQNEIYVWSRRKGQIEQLTHMTGEIGSLTWSPDGNSIGFLFVENATRNAGALAPMKPFAGVIGEDGIEIQRVGVVAIGSKTVAQVTPPNLHVYEFDWAPDSTRLAYIAAIPPGENNWWVAKLYTQTVDRPGTRNRAVSEPTLLVDTTTQSGTLHGLQLAVPRWSVDGKQIAFIGGLMSDQGSTGGDIYLVPSTGGEPKDLTPNRKASPAYISWIKEDALGVVEHVGGSSHITVLNPTTGHDAPNYSATFPDTIGSGRLAMSVSIAKNGDLAFIRSSFEHPPEVWEGSLDNMRQITHLNDDIKPAWGKTEDIQWVNKGFQVQGWLLYPANYDPAKTYPLLVSVHGGPSSAVTPRWPGVGYGGVPFSALGYFVFMPNPRGSYGQGEKFTQANVKDFGYGDLSDILKGMDTLESRLPIAKDREGLTGWSYGGFMTMFGVTQTTRFKAAVAGAGISDWKSYYGENSIDQWMVPFFSKTVYDDPAVYARSSAIEYIKNVKTPTLVVVGDRDGECPAPQSFEFWHALRAEGVKTQLVVYPDEGHSFQDPAHRKDVLERALNWFQAEMP